MKSFIFKGDNAVTRLVPSSGRWVQVNSKKEKTKQEVLLSWDRKQGKASQASTGLASFHCLLRFELFSRWAFSKRLLRIAGFSQLHAECFWNSQPELPPVKWRKKKERSRKWSESLLLYVLGSFAPLCCIVSWWAFTRAFECEMWKKVKLHLKQQTNMNPMRRE